MINSYERVNDSNDELLSDGDKADLVLRTVTSSRDRKANILLILAVVSAALSLVVSLLAASRTSSYSTSAPPATGPLRRPNAYIGLERVAFPADTTFPPIVNYPLSAFQIHVGDPKRRLSEDDRRHTEYRTTTVPEMRHVVISKNRSTVLQFRARDWGMEGCVLHFHIPGERTSLGCGTQVEVWDLKGVELLPHIVWDSAPSRRTQLGTFLFVPGETVGQVAFTCPSGSFPTIELAAAPENTGACGVDFWQGNDEVAIHIKQHWTHGRG